MSHLTTTVTTIKKAEILKKALKAKDLEFTTNIHESEYPNLTIKQKTGYDIDFVWNGKNYDLVTDVQFWDQPISIESFSQQLHKEYNYQYILEETEKLGFTAKEKLVLVNGGYSLNFERYS